MAFFGVCLGSCASNANETPAPTYAVEVRLTGTDGAALGPVADVSVKHDQQPDQHLIGTVVPDNGTTTIPLGNFKPTDELLVEVGFSKVDPTGGVRPRSASKVQGEVLVNGQVKAAVVLDNSVKYWSNSHYASTSVRVLVAK